jgi:hypothetical protein
MALTLLGTCWISPVRAATPAWMSSSVTAAALTLATTSPSASSVMVDSPSRMVAVYVLDVPTM